MYSRDQAAIERWCKNPEKLLQVGTMVLLSIRMQWSGVGNQMEDVAVNGSKSNCLWGWKRNGYKYLRDNRQHLYRCIRDRRACRTTTHELMREFLKVPGFGLPKAGFMVQLLTGNAGCLDMHNIERFGLDANVWTIRTYRDTAKQTAEIDDKIDLYLRLCEACGGSEKLWNEWCEYLNDKVSTFNGADDVSERHYIYLLDIPGD